MKIKSEELANRNLLKWKPINELLKKQFRRLKMAHRTRNIPSPTDT